MRECPLTTHSISNPSSRPTSGPKISPRSSGSLLARTRYKMSDAALFARVFVLRLSLELALLPAAAATTAPAATTSAPAPATPAPTPRRPHREWVAISNALFALEEGLSAEHEAELARDPRRLILETGIWKLLGDLLVADNFSPVVLGDEDEDEDLVWEFQLRLRLERLRLRLGRVLVCAAWEEFSRAGGIVPAAVSAPAVVPAAAAPRAAADAVAAEAADEEK
ncbi:hypothetical protein B0T20DRAFT_484434 [Sordaria brevicollis]|uniref:Uncharacterized protein n=1 Tax=Sordaria brevicollis TaxID=83679 RepID=A0AAE0NVQ3_SORBR|nr:hypothetical protein B0T20DRAFT_484434 [Sordaria brevicollis]